MSNCAKYPTVCASPFSPPGIFYRLNQTDNARGGVQGEGGFSKQRLYIYNHHVWKPKQRNSNTNMNQHFYWRNANLCNIRRNAMIPCRKFLEKFNTEIFRKHKFEQNGKFNMT